MFLKENIITCDLYQTQLFAYFVFIPLMFGCMHIF